MTHHLDVEHATRYGVSEALLINALRYWLRKNRAEGRNQIDGRSWSFASCREFAGWFPYWSPPQVRRVVASLVAQGVIEHVQDRSGDRTSRYAFVDEARFLDGVQTATISSLEHASTATISSGSLAETATISSTTATISSLASKEHLGTTSEEEAQQVQDLEPVIWPQARCAASPPVDPINPARRDLARMKEELLCVTGLQHAEWVAFEPLIAAGLRPSDLRAVITERQATGKKFTSLLYFAPICRDLLRARSESPAPPASPQRASAPTPSAEQLAETARREAELKAQNDEWERVARLGPDGWGHLDANDRKFMVGVRRRMILRGAISETGQGALA